MRPHYRDIVKHSGVYGFGLLLSRLASVLMLPVYTRFLTPADYGTIAILDLTTTALGLVFSGGIMSAIARYDHDAETERERDTVWWTALASVAGFGGIIVALGIAFRWPLAVSTLGPQEPSGGIFYLLVLVTLWFNTLSGIYALYFRMRRWSWLTVGLSLAGLVLNVMLNVYFLAVLRWGVTAVLVGNLATSAIMTLIRFVIAKRACGRFCFDPRLALTLARFSAPLVVTMLLATAMHQADRYILRRALDLHTVGVYSLAYQLGQGVNALFLIPFSMVWSVEMYEIAKTPDAKASYVLVFRYFVYALMLLLFAVSLFVRPLMSIMASREYADATHLVPIICLSFVFFSLDEHFRVPALLAKQTVNLIPGNAIGAATNILLNLMLVPMFGAVAAAWVSVSTYAIFAGVTLILCRRIDRYDYPLGRCALVLAGMIVTFAICERIPILNSGQAGSLALRAAIWAAWAGSLAFPLWKQVSWPRPVAVRP